jgi:hypothetical protein
MNRVEEPVGRTRRKDPLERGGRTHGKNAAEIRETPPAKLAAKTQTPDENSTHT